MAPGLCWGRVRVVPSQISVPLCLAENEASVCEDVQYGSWEGGLASPAKGVQLVRWRSQVRNPVRRFDCTGLATRRLPGQPGALWASKGGGSLPPLAGSIVRRLVQKLD